MPVVSRDTAFLARPRWIGRVTAVIVRDGWLRQAVVKAATSLPDHDRQDLDPGVQPNTINRVACMYALIGQPLVVATIDPKVLRGQKLADWLATLANVAINPTVIICPHEKDLPELVKDTKDKKPWHIIRESDLGKKPERIAMADMITATFRPKITNPEEWQELATEWLKTAPDEESSPTAMRLALDFAHAVATDDAGKLDVIKAREAVAQDNSRKYFDILPHMVSAIRTGGQRPALLLLQEIAKNIGDDDTIRKFCAAIEKTAIDLATCTNQIPQAEDPAVPPFVRTKIQEQGNLTPKQIIQVSILAQKLAHAIRTSPNPMSACSTILQQA